jgi:hypothetical protein
MFRYAPDSGAKANIAGLPLGPTPIMAAFVRAPSPSIIDGQLLRKDVAHVMDVLMGHFVYICIFMHLVDVQARMQLLTS